MNDVRTLALIVCGMALLLIVLVAVIVYVCIYHAKSYRNFKKPVKTVGVVEDVEYVDDSDEEDSNSQYWLITYSYEDNSGQRQYVTFQWRQNLFKSGDKILLHYDSQNPQNCIADCQLRYGKNLWWKVLIILAVLIVPAVFIAIMFG